MEDVIPWFALPWWAFSVFGAIFLLAISNYILDEYKLRASAYPLLGVLAVVLLPGLVTIGVVVLCCCKGSWVTHKISSLFIIPKES